MFKRGPISPFVHGVLDYLLAAPKLLDPKMFETAEVFFG